MIPRISANRLRSHATWLSAIFPSTSSGVWTAIQSTRIAYRSAKWANDWVCWTLIRSAAIMPGTIRASHRIWPVRWSIRRGWLWTVLIIFTIRRAHRSLHLFCSAGLKLRQFSPFACNAFRKVQPPQCFLFFSFLSGQVPPKIVPFTFGDESANFGEPASVQCSVVLGDFPIDIVWQRNGQPVDEDLVATAKLGKRLSVLNIDSVSGSHAGNYSCAASNLAGQTEHTAELRVNGMQ